MGRLVTDDPVARAGRERPLLPCLFGGEGARAQRFLDDIPDVVLVERLGDVVKRARLQRFHRVVDRAMRRDDDHRQVWLQQERASQQLEPVEPRHAQVGDEHIDVLILEYAQRRFPISDRMHLVAIATELRSEHTTQVRLVVDDQDLTGSVSNHSRPIVEHPARGLNLLRDREVGKTAIATPARPGACPARLARSGYSGAGASSGAGAARASSEGGPRFEGGALVTAARVAHRGHQEAAGRRVA